jgi:hypothetical protein
MTINSYKRDFLVAGLATLSLGLSSLGAAPAIAEANPVAGIEPISSSAAVLPEVSISTSTQAEPFSSIEPLPQSSPSVAPPEDFTQPIAQTADSIPEAENLEVSQAVISPGRSTRSGPSYLGIGANIGLGGDTTLGDSGFTVISKIGLTRNLSARPSVVIGDNDPAILLPLTVDFPISSVLETGEVNLEAAPFVGGGIAISTGSDSLVRPLITAGIDVPVASRVTATAAVNFAFFDDTEVGLTLGAGYSF